MRPLYKILAVLGVVAVAAYSVVNLTAGSSDSCTSCVEEGSTTASAAKNSACPPCADCP